MEYQQPEITPEVNLAANRILTELKSGPRKVFLITFEHGVRVEDYNVTHVDGCDRVEITCGLIDEED